MKTILLSMAAMLAVMINLSAQDTWTQKANFGGGSRDVAVGFSIPGKGHIGTGERILKNMREYAPNIADTCTSPAGLNVLKVIDTAALLSWTQPAELINSYKIRYRAAGLSELFKESTEGNGTQVVLHGLQSATAYEWQIRSNCAADTSAWICGPDFKTAASYAIIFGSSNYIYSKLPTGSGVQIIPNPNKGNFTVLIQLPAKNTLTTLALYNGDGKMIWQQQLGNTGGYINTHLTLDDKLSKGIYLLLVERSDLHLSQKVFINK